MTPAPFRLGLTAPIRPQEQIGERWRLDELIGPIVYEKRLEELVGQQLADYRTERIHVDLTPDERRCYDAHYALYSTYLRTHGLYRSGPRWWVDLLRLSATDAEARSVVLARQQIGRLLANAEGKRPFSTGCCRTCGRTSADLC
jgi:superfamily II DNA or RNA helicase